MNPLQEENVSPYDPRGQTQSLFNSSELSDVRFLVENETVCAHKLILAMGSPVFKNMFFGELKEERSVISIIDLTTSGFKNAVRYIYGFEIDYELAELCESYMAADKYLLHGFSKAFFDYIQSQLNAKTCCLIYDQLIKIGERSEIPLAEVRTVIIHSSKETFESEHFTKIDQRTLISLLSLDRLDIDEVDLLAAVSRWVDCEMQRQGLPVTDENRRRVFEPIKGYVLFTALNLEKVANNKEIPELLRSEEIGSLVLHLLNDQQPLAIQLKTQRKAGANVYRVFVGKSRFIAAMPYTRKVCLSANRPVVIRTIHTTYSSSSANLKLKIRDWTGKEFSLKADALLKAGKWCFSITPHLEIKPNKLYSVKVYGDKTMKEDDELTKQRQLKDDKTVFTLSEQIHCIRGLEFFVSD